MADLIQAITPGFFPYSRRPRARNEFSRWLASRPVNENGLREGPLMLSMEDEIMLAKLRELARPFPARNPYLQAAGIVTPTNSVDENGQYVMPFLIETAGGVVDREI